MDATESPGSEASQPTTQTDPVPKKAGTSVVWNYFGFKEDDKSQSDVLCKECLTVVAPTKGNTTNLYQHLQRNLKLQYDEAVQGKRFESRPTVQRSITATLYNTMPYPSNSRRSKEITEAIANHLAKIWSP